MLDGVALSAWNTHCVKTNKEYLELKNGRIENLQIMKVDEQNHINILKYDLSQQYDKEKEKELQYWYLQIDYTDALENAYVKNDNEYSAI